MEQIVNKLTALTALLQMPLKPLAVRQIAEEKDYFRLKLMQPNRFEKLVQPNFVLNLCYYKFFFHLNFNDNLFCYIF